MLLCELGQSQAVVDGLIAGFDHKTPKVVLSAVDTLFMVVSSFGVRTVRPNAILSALPGLLEKPQNNVREFAKQLLVELARWLGVDTIGSTVLGRLRAASKKDVESLLAEVRFFLADNSRSLSLVFRFTPYIIGGMH